MVQSRYHRNILTPNHSFTNEQMIINRSISKLLEAIKLANQSLREAILASEQKRFEDELVAEEKVAPM